MLLELGLDRRADVMTCTSDRTNDGALLTWIDGKELLVIGIGSFMKSSRQLVGGRSSGQSCAKATRSEELESSVGHSEHLDVIGSFFFSAIGSTNEDNPPEMVLSTEDLSAVERLFVGG